jgi:hypothetical protein
MKATRAKQLLVTAFVGLLAATTSWSQQVSGSISGTVRDAGGAIIPNAKVKLVDVLQNDVREGASNNDGIFLFNPLKPSTYTLTIEVSGFKRHEQKEIKVFANDRVTLGDISLQVGSISDSVTVAAEGGEVQLKLAGGEKSGVLTGNQTVNLALLTRDFLQLTRTLPGVVQNGGVGGAVNGNRNNSNNLTVDGVTNIDTGSNGGQLATMNIDMIAEFKVLTNSQPAEFGRSSGAQIAVVTKSGTKEFHGTFYDFYRHESMNANNWINNQRGIAKNRYRFNYPGFNIGGPAFIPGLFNKNKEKLFFFAGIEWQNQLINNSIRSVTVPTALQRQGNYAGTLEGDGRTPVFIRDPLSNQPCAGATGGPGCFANNLIPANRISADGQKILNFYPLPNIVGVDPSFNYQTAVSGSFPRREHIFRGDYNINEKWRYYGRYMFTKSSQNMPYGQWNADYNIPFAPMNFGNPGWSLVNNVTTTINPTLTNEFIFGSSRNVLNIDPVDDTFKRSKLNLSYRMPFPDADKLDLIQNWRFGGVPNGPTSNFAGTPFRNFNHTWDITDNIAKIWGSHQFKFGIYMQKSQKDQTAFTSINGDINFDRDAQNPLDTNWAFSNALTGTFRTLAQSNRVLNGQYRSWNVEWYAQDSWRVNSKLTIDYGMRFYWIQPQYDAALQTSSFNPGLYQQNARAQLVQPFRNAAGARVGRNPVTGAETPAALIGSIITGGQGFVNGLYANGMGLAGQNGYPRGLLDNRGIHYAPRLGVAWQFMDKTVLRAGAGIFFDRFQGNPVFDMLPNPPSTTRPTLFYSTLGQIASTQGTFFPAGVRGFDQQGKVPTTYQWNLSIQRQVGFKSVVEVGYVANIGRHLLNRFNLNAAPLGSAWLPQNQDPTAAGTALDGSRALPINFYRPFAGFDNASVTGFGATSSYHSLQASWNRNMGKGLNFGVSYTFSKALGLVNGDQDETHPFNARMGNYGFLDFDTPHNLVFNYIYDIPKIAKGSNFLDNKVGRVVFNGWQVSGLTTMQAGFARNVSMSVAGIGDLNRRWTGSENVGPRPFIVGAPNSPSNRGEMAWIDTSVFRLPAQGTSAGLESSLRTVRIPGIHNWDVSIFKNIPFSADSKRNLQLRVEMFNAPNHTQFSDFNRSMTFNAQGQITNLPSALGGGGGRYGFGAVNAARDPRFMQLAAKFYW